MIRIVQSSESYRDLILECLAAKLGPEDRTFLRNALEAYACLRITEHQEQRFTAVNAMQTAKEHGRGA